MRCKSSATWEAVRRCLEIVLGWDCDSALELCGIQSLPPVLKINKNMVFRPKFRKISNLNLAAAIAPHPADIT
ncbi:hypothetical protein ACF3DV_12880 [Chlorogloeopsis fritschii PCC 9212]|jgi:hypothetical protein|uniref:hypothetical protein n=1 Tax=Chlorogloeopsis fritschii TaxID=1124 RepID=UPI00138ACE1A|nr:hypothetical protein [Chlorogloeopsis fritschii]MBF2008416.1 hypothetical protein [Chlorogloeopsis fritschii C42_A2020_084]